MRSLVIIASSIAFAGCTTVNTSTRLSPSTAPEGLSYSLPTRPLTIDLVYDQDRGFAIAVALLPAVADARAPSFMLGYQGSAFDSDTVQWTTVDGLLTSVSATSVNKLVDTAQAAGESAGSQAAALETDVEPGRQTVVQLNLDPVDSASAQRAAAQLTAAMQSFARTELARLAVRPPAKKMAVADNAARTLRSAILTRATTATIVIVSDFGPPPAAAAADCSIGICYRALRYGEVTISTGGVPVTQVGMTIPNGMPPIAFRVRLSGAANSATTLTLDRGTLASVSISKDAEGPTIARIPGAIVGGVIKGFTDTITARKGSLAAQTEYKKAQKDDADAEAALITARQALDKARAGSGSIEASIDGKTSTLIWLSDGLSSAPVATSSPAAVGTGDIPKKGKAKPDAEDDGKDTKPGKPGTGANPQDGGKASDGATSPPGTGGKPGKKSE